MAKAGAKRIVFIYISSYYRALSEKAGVAAKHESEKLKESFNWRKSLEK